MVRKSVPNSPLQWLLLSSGERVASELVPVTSGYLESMMVPIPSSQTWRSSRRVSSPLHLLLPHSSLSSEVQFLSLRLGQCIGSVLLSSIRGEGIGNFTLHNPALVASLTLNKADTLPKLVQFSVCMLYSPEPLGQRGGCSMKGGFQLWTPPWLPAITIKLRYVVGQISSWRKTPSSQRLP